MHLSRRSISAMGMATFALALILSTAANAGAVPLAAERPGEEAFRTGLRKELSAINISIEASANELSDTLNRVVARELYRGSTRTKELTADILRNGPIVATASGNYLYLTIPVTISLSYGAFETPAASARLKFRLYPRVTADWKINAEVRYMGLSDLLTEEVGIGPLSIKPRSIVEGVTQPMQRNLSELANRKLNEKFPLKTQVEKAWNAAQKPILLDANYNAWLKIAPREVLIYPFYAQGDQLKLSLGLRSFAELVVGPEPQAGTPLPLPVLRQQNGADRTFRVALNTDLFYGEILRIATPLLLNREVGSEGKSVIVKGLDLSGNGDRLLVKVETTGSLDGTFYLTCRPVFNAQTNIFSVEDVDFDMKSKSLLMKAADWFLHGTIRRTIQERLNMDLTQRLATAREMAGRAMARVKLAENVYLTGNVRTVKLGDVLVQRDRLSIQLLAEGETAIIFH